MPNGWYFSSTLLYPTLFFYFIFYIITFAGGGATCMYKSQKTTGESWLSPSPVFVPETELRLLSWQQGPLLLSHLTHPICPPKERVMRFFFSCCTRPGIIFLPFKIFLAIQETGTSLEWTADFQGSCLPSVKWLTYIMLTLEYLKSI